MQNDSTQPTQPAPDVILRSSDKALFHSWKTVLSISSSVFSDMFTLSQQSADAHTPDDGRPIIDLSEDKRTIENIISLCHPPSFSGKKYQPIGTLEEVHDVLEAATKYDMVNLRLVVLGELTNPAFLCTDPVRVYALACQYGQREVARLAAKHTSALPTLLARGYIPEFEKVHAGLFCRLVLYREECVAAVCALTEDHSWIVYKEDVSSLSGCSGDHMEWTKIRRPPSRKYPKGSEESILMHKWWKDYMMKSACALQRSPCGNVVKDPKLVDKVLTDLSSLDCSQCNTPEVRERFKSFVSKFAQKVDDRVAKVEIDVGF